MADDELMRALLQRYAPQPEATLADVLQGRRSTADLLGKYGVPREQAWGGLKSYIPESARNAMADLAQRRDNAMSYIPPEAMFAANFLSPGARVPMKPKTLEWGAHEGEPGFAYHVTNAERLHDIADSGHLQVHDPWEFTDQGAWPDGSVEKRSYFSSAPLPEFAPEEGMPVALRTKTGGHIFKEKTGDLFARKPIEAAQLEYLGEDGGWHPVSNLRNPESQ